MVINQHLRLSPTLHALYNNIVDFKVDFHNLDIRGKKDSQGIWNKFPYFVANEDILGVICRNSHCRSPDNVIY